ncbi:hypothetical protein QBC38DRAFT_145487 [Podospora fimiseda]|uniref:Uncharacterized protein n=1 Tax=Podospora fimiseda TaxID=252190 RepID=A0AAN7BZL1_9PEZI|nr:hypothetical protein QBC38DRAFT_145487 [Podospora fimiseda]
MEVESRLKPSFSDPVANSAPSYTGTDLQSANNRVTMNPLPPTITNDMNNTIHDAASEADDAMSDIFTAPNNTTLQPSPAKASSSATAARGGRGRGRGSRGGRGGRIIKPAQAKAQTGRGRRQKVYDSSKAQAAHERMQELKQAFSTIVKVVKPAVQEIADRSVNELLQDPTAFEKVPEYRETQDFLQERVEDTKAKATKARKFGLEMANRVYENEQKAAREACTRQIEDLMYDRLGQMLQQLDRLEFLHDHNLPVDLVNLPDEDFEYVKITVEEANSQGPFVEYAPDGIELPFSGRSVKELMVKPQTLSLEVSKRKADGQPEGQPPSKVAAVAKEEEAVPSMPRHTASLLGAVDAIDESEATPQDSSNAPTPAAEPADDVAGTVERPRASADPVPADVPGLPIPRGATGPDEFGVRLIARRPTRMDMPNNRIMVPNLFDWDEHDIGFRDSTNSAQKGATRARRGKYMEKPGSNFMFIDRRVGIWDSTEAAGEFNDSLIKKHGLHPTLGIFLPTSINLEEPPTPHADGWKTKAFVPPSGEIIYASRTIAAAHRERVHNRMEVKMVSKINMTNLLSRWCEEEGLSMDDIAPDAEVMEERRKEFLLEHKLDPETIFVQSPTPPSPTPEPAVQDTAGFDQFVNDALRAAAEKTKVKEAEPRRPVATKSAKSSRPYDAIRDVFLGNATEQQSQDVAPPPAAATDDSSLRCLADAAVRQESVSEYSAVDPALYNQSQPNGVGKVNEYEQGEYPRPMEYTQAHTEPAPYMQPIEAPRPAEPSRSNDFLMTALNPPSPASSYPPPPTAEYSGAPAPSQSTALRPFGNLTSAKSLPALRPMRNVLNDPSPPPESQQSSPAMQHGSMVMTNGTYYQSAPVRPYHNGYAPIPEPLQIHPIQPSVMQPGPLQAPLAAVPDSRHMNSYSVSPPPYLTVQPGLASLASMGQQQPGAGSANGQQNSSKYRKLEPAPTPPHRQSFSANGQELRTVQFDYRESIKDYPAVEAPPRHGPTQIRGWSYNNQNVKKTNPATRPNSSKGDATNNSEEPA